MRRNRRRTGLFAAIAAVALAAVVVPAAAVAAAEHILIQVVDEPTPWDPFEEPCTGTVVHGLGIENGQVKITELGPRGHHVQVRVDGEVDLLDDEEDLVGTWTYHVRFSDQFPPGAQGAVTLIAKGPVEYADESTAVITIHTHEVFEKGDTLKREFLKASCRR